MADEAVAMTETTRRQIADLGEAGQAVGNVVQLITSVAERTNLLALNAVKDLAQQTATTSEMSRASAEAATGTRDVAATVVGVAEVASRSTPALRRRCVSLE